MIQKDFSECVLDSKWSDLWERRILNGKKKLQESCEICCVNEYSKNHLQYPRSFSFSYLLIFSVNATNYWYRIYSTIVSNEQGGRHAIESVSQGQICVSAHTADQSPIAQRSEASVPDSKAFQSSVYGLGLGSVLFRFFLRLTPKCMNKPI